MKNYDKNNKKTEVTSGGTGFCSLLTIAFIVLKLCGVISWSWLWVLAPLWIPIALSFAIIAVFAMGCAISVLVKHILDEED